MKAEDLIKREIDFGEEGRNDNSPFVITKLECIILMELYLKKKVDSISKDDIGEAVYNELEDTFGVDYGDLEDLCERGVKWALNKVKEK